MAKFKDKAVFVKRKEGQIESKQGYIDRNSKSSYFNSDAYAQLDALKSQHEQAKRQLNNIVISLQDKFNKLNDLVGAENTLELRTRTGLEVSEAGYSPYIFNTEIEDEERKAEEETAGKANAVKQAKKQKWISIWITLIVVWLLLQFLAFIISAIVD